MLQQAKKPRKRQAPVTATATGFAFWDQEEVFESCVKFIHEDKPPEVQLVINDRDCKKCASLCENMKLLHENKVVAITKTDFVKQHDHSGREDSDDDDDDRSEDDSDDGSKTCHAVCVFGEQLKGWDEFCKRFSVKPEKLLPKQKEFVLDYSAQSEHSCKTGQPTDPVAVVWTLGTGKTKAAKVNLLGSQRLAAPKVLIICPKSVIPQWADEIVNTRPRGKTEVWIMAPSYFNRVTAGELKELTPVMLRNVSMIVDEWTVFKNETESKKLDIATLKSVRELYLLSGTPVSKAKDVEPFLNMLRVGLRKSNGQYRTMQEVCDILCAKKQISYFNPKLTDPAWYKEHFPDLTEETKHVSLTWTQTARCLMADGKLLLGPDLKNLTCFGDPQRNAYKTRTRMFCNTAETQSGLVLSPKIDDAVEMVLQNPGKRFAVYSNYRDLGIRSVAKKLDKHKFKYVLIDGNERTKDRERSQKLYNSHKVDIILYSNAAGLGINLMDTDYLLQIGVEPQAALREQAAGRVVRFHSGPKVTIVQYVAGLPDPSLSVFDDDWVGMCELWSKLVGSRAGHDCTSKAHFVKCIQQSLKEFGITQTAEEQLLDSQKQEDEQTKDFKDMIALAGTRVSDSTRKRLREKLGFDDDSKSDTNGEQLSGDETLSLADRRTFANVCKRYKRADMFEMVTGDKLDMFLAHK